MKMNCLECGTLVTPDQQFCRSCGTSLVLTSAGPAGDPAISPSQKIRLAGFISVFAGLAVALTGRMLLHAEWIVYIGVLMNFLGMFLVVYPSIVPQRRRKAAISVEGRPGNLQAAPTTKKLTPMDDTFIVPSVTESTTDLLKTPAAKATKTESPLP